MYGGILPRFCATDAQQRCDFFDPYFSLKTHFRHFPTRRTYFFLKIKFRMFFAVHCVLEASKFSLNHNLAQASKQNSVQEPKKVQNSIPLFFYRNYNYYTKCVIWCILTNPQLIYKEIWIFLLFSVIQHAGYKRKIHETVKFGTIHNNFSVVKNCYISTTVFHNSLDWLTDERKEIWLDDRCFSFSWFCMSFFKNPYLFLYPMFVLQEVENFADLILGYPEQFVDYALEQVSYVNVIRSDTESLKNLKQCLCKYVNNWLTYWTS